MAKQQVDIDLAATTFKLLGDQTRLTMIRILESHDCCVCEFVALFQMSQPAISQHLRKLKNVNLVQESRRGQWIFYSLNKESEVYPMVQSILEHIPNQTYRLKELEEKGLRISCN